MGYDPLGMYQLAQSIKDRQQEELDRMDLMRRDDEDRRQRRIAAQRGFLTDAIAADPSIDLGKLSVLVPDIPTGELPAYQEIQKSRRKAASRKTLEEETIPALSSLVANAGTPQEVDAARVGASSIRQQIPDPQEFASAMQRLTVLANEQRARGRIGGYAAEAADWRELKKQRFTDEKELRDEFMRSSGEFVKQRDSFRRIVSSAEDPSPAGDLSLIFNYMKILDPGSVVRESEFATAQNTGSVPQRVWSLYNRVLDGTRLTTQQRADFMSRSRKLYGGARKDHRSREISFKGLAQRNRLNPRNVVLDLKGEDLEPGDVPRVPAGTPEGTVYLKRDAKSGNPLFISPDGKVFEEQPN